MKSYTFTIEAVWRGQVTINSDTQDEAAKHIPDYVGYRAGFIPSEYDVLDVQEDEVTVGGKPFRKGECC